MEKINASLITSQPDPMVLCEIVDGLKAVGITSQLDTFASAIAVDIRTGEFMQPSMVDGLVHLRRKNPFAEDSAMIAGAFTPKENRSAAQLVINQSTGNFALPADYGKYRGSTFLSSISDLRHTL